MSRSYQKTQLVSGLLCNAEGPCVRNPAGELVPVHLRQGDVDGACGPYALMMALLLFGLADAQALKPMAGVDRRTRLSKFFKALREEDAETLFKAGTDIDQLEAVLTKSYAKKIETRRWDGEGTESREFVLESLRRGAPTLLRIAFEEGAHWLLIVGAEYEVTVDDAGAEREEALSLLALDSSGPTTNAAPWNAWVDWFGEAGGRWPCRYVNCGMSSFRAVQLCEGLALHRR
jgi:hypothetical protein